MVKFEEITKIFKADVFKKEFKALDCVSFEIPEGTLMGYLGANGAGKTTSIKILMDFIKPSHGKVSYARALGKTKNEVFKHLGYLPERPYFYPFLTGREFIEFMGKLAEMKTHQINQGIEKWAPRFKIEHALDRELRNYSKGMLQRIGFLATVIHQPKLIILDEPLSGLDPLGRKDLKDIMLEVNKQGVSVFFSSHIVSDVEEVCDQVVFIKEGKLIYQGSVDEIIQKSSGSKSLIKSSKKIAELNPVLIKDNLYLYETESSQKEKVLTTMISQGADIVSLEQDKMSLEEIFYQVKA